jgi:putative SOS response-associated peptidase YedK
MIETGTSQVFFHPQTGRSQALMCGRYSLTKPIKTLKEHFQAIAEEMKHNKRYNIAPSQSVPIVIAGEQNREIHTLRWGLIPSWAKDPALGNKLINARAETVHEKPSFKSSLKNRRCLVPVDGFYEWQASDQGKVPQYIQLRTGGLFAFAGLWSEWDSGKEILRTFTIITTTANRELESVHHRMPVILMPQDYDKWLTSSSQEFQGLLKPLGEGLLDHYEINKTVNSPKNDSEECIAPVSES